LTISANVNTAVQITDRRNEDTLPLCLSWEQLVENREHALFISQTEGVKGMFKE